MAEITTLREAIAELVHDGDAIAREGFTHLIPLAAGHEILRQGRTELELIRMTPDIPDVAIVHAQEADREGNVQLRGIPGCRRRRCSAAIYARGSGRAP